MPYERGEQKRVAYWIKFEREHRPNRLEFHSINDMFRYLDRMFIERGLIEWMILDETSGRYSR